MESKDDTASISDEMNGDDNLNVPTRSQCCNLVLVVLAVLLVVICEAEWK